MAYQLLLQNIMKNTREDRQQGADSLRETPESIFVFYSFGELATVNVGKHNNLYGE